MMVVGRWHHRTLWCVALLMVVCLCVDVSNSLEILSISDHRELSLSPEFAPVDVVLLEQGAQMRNFSQNGCKPGTKCPMEGGVCCPDDNTKCCLYGCSLDDMTKQLVCKKNRFPHLMDKVRQMMQMEADDEDRKKLWKMKNQLKTEQLTNKLEQMKHAEELHKKEATKNEEGSKQRRQMKEEKTKKTRGQHFAHRRRMIEAKINEEESKKAPKDIPLKNRCLKYSRGYMGPKYLELSGECFVEGMIMCPQQNKLVAKLPPTCRPPGRVVFDVHIADCDTARYDVKENGEIIWSGGSYRSGGNLGHWIPLSGISFTTRNALLGENPKVSQVRLPLVRPWVDFGKAGYQGGRFRVINPPGTPSLCVISGLIRTSDWRSSAMTNPIFTLGPDCRPDKRLAFQVNHHEFSFRVDILPNGQGHLVSGKKKHPWISLSGIQFFLNGTRPLQLLGEWYPHGESFRSPMVTKWENLCVLTGMARNKGWTMDIAKVPDNCIPGTNHRHVFAVVGSQGESGNTVSVNEAQRIDILTDGTIRWVDGVKSKYVSFDGIQYTVP